MDVTAELLAELERLAGEATPGEWVRGVTPDDPAEAKRWIDDAWSAGSPGPAHMVIVAKDGVPLEEECWIAALTGNGPTGPQNAAFIAAANPETVGALVARVRELEARIETDKRVIDYQWEYERRHYAEVESQCAVMRSALASVRDCFAANGDIDRDIDAALAPDAGRSLSEEVRRLREENERLQVQLAGCSVAALGYGDDCKPGDYGWSASFGDVLLMHEEVRLLREVEAAATRAVAEIRHAYRAAYLAHSEVRRHDDGLMSRAIVLIETALNAVASHRNQGSKP